MRVPRHRHEALVHAEIPTPRRLQLLEHGIRASRSEDVARQEEHRQPVDRRGRGAGHHVRRSRPDRGRAREGGEAVPHLRKPGCDVHHALLVARLVVGEQLWVLRQRLSNAGQVAVAEDAEAPLYETVLDPIAL